MAAVFHRVRLRIPFGCQLPCRHRWISGQVLSLRDGIALFNRFATNRAPLHPDSIFALFSADKGSEQFREHKTPVQRKGAEKKQEGAALGENIAKWVSTSRT